jgi:hypothetical protein
MNFRIAFFRAIVGVWCLVLASIAQANMPTSNGSGYYAAPPAPVFDGPDAADEVWDTNPDQCLPGDCFYYRWQIWVNAIYLTRPGAEDISLAFGDASDPNGTEVLDTQDMNFGFQWGPHIGLYFCLNDCNSFGAEFFTIDGWSARGAASGDISVAFPSAAHLPQAPPVAPLFGAAEFFYNSTLSSTEINVRHRTNDWLVVLAGFRAVELGEEFSTTFTTGPGTSSYLIDVDNQLYGFQIGAVTNVRNGVWGFDGWAKAGIYGNSADLVTSENLVAMGGGSASVAADDSSAAFAGEVGIAALRQLTDRLAVRIGYQAMWLEGVALAPDQLDNVNPSIPLAIVDVDGGAFYHGGFAGLEYLW